MQNIKVLVFGGTEEGKNISQFISSLGIYTVVSVVSECARQLIDINEHLHISVKRMNENEIRDFIIKEKFSFVVDATHPYAREITNIVEKVCNDSKVKYIRILRKQYNNKYGKVFKNAESVVDYLREKDGTIFLTIGTKDLHKFVKIDGYKKRLYIRILPVIESLEICNKFELPSKNIICMQGPFSIDLNSAIFKQIKPDFIVTKESGKEGGFDTKIEAAKILNLETLIIERPKESKGFFLKDAKEEIKKYLYKKETEIKSI